ncbi:hypothetical protein [Deinococcus apachensis]|uniref:hypothetical protein n=1 Tax=Deinococcus apachensis TaxID=309886 RepID=UPI00036DD709|nr:hypothetical protein [Deinococcus apachensis]
MTRRPRPTLRVVSIEMADGSDIDSPEARARIARALLSIPVPQPAPLARDEQAQAVRPA